MIDLAVFFSAVRKTLFPNGLTKGQVDGMERIIKCWEDEYSKNRWKIQLAELAYILATIYHETGKVMRPIKEGGGQQYLRSKKYYSYIGVGLVQVTWAANWKRWGISSIEDGLSWPIALRATFEGMAEGAFTGKKLSDYIGNGRRDYVGARRIINGTDRAQLIAGYAEKFREALLAAEQKQPTPAPVPEAATADFRAWLLAALREDEEVREAILALVYPGEELTDEPNQVSELDPMDEPHDEYGPEMAYADNDYGSA